jgi:hypothetical protein
MVKARWIDPAMVDRLKPGRSGVTAPIAPPMRKTGTTGPDLKNEPIKGILNALS